MEAVITVVGNDKVGILAQVCTACAEANVNVEEVTQRNLRHDHAGGCVQLLDGFYGLCREDEAEGRRAGRGCALHPAGNL